MGWERPEPLAGLGEKADTQMTGGAMARGRKWRGTGHDWTTNGKKAYDKGNRKYWEKGSSQNSLPVFQVKRVFKGSRKQPMGTTEGRALWHWQQSNAALSLAFLWTPRLNCSPRESTHTPKSLEVGWDLMVRCASTWLSGTQLEDSPAARDPRDKANRVTAPLPLSNPGKKLPWRKAIS